MDDGLLRVEPGRARLLDGAMGTALIARGLPLGAAPERWVLERPAEVAAVHRGHVAAGAEIVHTCTFGGSRPRLAAAGLADRLEEVQRRAVALARDSGARWVLGDLGPTGVWAPPRGEAGEAAWAEAFREQAAALVAAGVDGLHVETGLDLREVRVAVREAVAVASGRPVLASFALGWRDGDWRTLAGDSAERCWEAALAAGATAVGANCQVDSRGMSRLAERALAAFPGVPLVFQPNAGQPRAAGGGGFVYDQDPEVFAEDMAALARRGVALVGGCCGTDARFVAALRRALDRPG